MESVKKYCKTCFEILTRKPNETKQNFDKRTHCGRKCVPRVSGKKCRHNKMVGCYKEAKL